MAFVGGRSRVRGRPGIVQGDWRGAAVDHMVSAGVADLVAPAGKARPRGSEQGAETNLRREGWRAHCSVAFMSPQTIAGMPTGQRPLPALHATDGAPVATFCRLQVAARTGR